MINISFQTRVFSFVPGVALRRIAGEQPSVLISLINKQNLGIRDLAACTGLDYSRVKQTVLGNKPPISTRGSWTREAVAIATVLRTDPEAIFPKALDMIGSAMVNPDNEMLASLFLKKRSS